MVRKRHPVVADCHAAQVIIIANAGEHEIRAMTAASDGVGAICPPCSSTHFSALARVRL
jgi:hypothetical protein